MNIVRIKEINDDSLLSMAEVLYRCFKASTYFINEKVRRHFITKEKLDDVLTALIRHDKAYKDMFILLQGKGAVGIAQLAHLEFDSKIFRKKMGRLSIHLADEADFSIDDGRQAVRALIAQAAKEGFEHISSKLNISQQKIMPSLERESFYFVGGLITFVYVKGKTRISKWKSLYRVRPARAADKAILMKIAHGSFTKSRFYNDPSMDHKRCNSFYKNWVNNCFEARWARKVIIAEDSKKKVAGFITYKGDADIKKNLHIIKGGNGLSACVPTAKGAYLSLLSSTIENDAAREKPDFVEYETQLDNVDVIRIWQRFGLEFGRVEMVFHKTMGSL